MWKRRRSGTVSEDELEILDDSVVQDTCKKDSSTRTVYQSILERNSISKCREGWSRNR